MPAIRNKNCNYISNKEIKITFDDWIFKQDSNVAINRATMKKFGFKVFCIKMLFTPLQNISGQILHL